LFGRELLPGIGTEVISAEHKVLKSQTCIRSDFFCKLSEIPGPQSCVPAELVHLIARRLYQKQRPIGDGLFSRSAENKGVRRADRIYPRTVSGSLPLQVMLKSMHGYR
jgi:hypothetical protein